MPTNQQLLEYKYTNEKQFPKIINLKEGSTPGEYYAKAFLIDERVNKNDWNVPNESMEKYSTGFIGKPLINYPGFDHPDYIKEGVASDSKSFVNDVLKVQQGYKVGEIRDVKYEPRDDDPSKKAWYAYIKLTNNDFINRFRSGSIPFFVSPQVYDTNENPDYTNESGVEGTVADFIPLHLAIVKEPAYGNVARVRAICNGTGPVCLNALKSAAENMIAKIDGFKENRDNSSFFENSGSNGYKLTNKLYNEDEMQNNPAANGQGQNFNQQTNGNNTAFSNPSPIATRTINETETDDGRKITKTEDVRTIQTKKNGNNAANNSSSPPELQNTPNSPEINQTPSVANPQDTQLQGVNPSAEVQLPKEVIDALAVVKQFQQDREADKKELEDLKNFRSKYEEERTKRAAEEQRGVIEGYFTEAVIADPTAREEMINFFTTLNLTNDQLTKILDLIVSGGFQSASVDKDGKKVTKKNTVRSASIENMEAGAIMNSIYNARGYRPNSVYTEGLFGDINLENL